MRFQLPTPSSATTCLALHCMIMIISKPLLAQTVAPSAAPAARITDGSASHVGNDAAPEITEPVFKNDKNVWSYEVSSAYLSGTNEIEVLLPDNFDKMRKYRVLYALPVEPGIGGLFGDSLQEIRKTGLQDRYGLICVAAAFDTRPWFGANPTNPRIRHEDYMMKIVAPLIESRYPTIGDREGRLLLGFSKSGCGAFSLILRNPDFFGYACSWDAPLMVNWPGGWGIREHFGTQENFERYQVSKLLEKQAAQFRGKVRLVLLGETLFGKAVCPDPRGHTVAAHEMMTALGIRHAYRDDLHFTHSWVAKGGPDKGWLKPAIIQLMEAVNTSD